MMMMMMTVIIKQLYFAALSAKLVYSATC